MLNLPENEVEHLRQLGDGLDYQFYPPSFQTQLLVEFLISRGATGISVSDIQELFSAAQVVSSNTGKVVRPAAGKIRGYLERFQKSQEFPIERKDDTATWLVTCNRYLFLLNLEIQANDRLHAKDLAQRATLPGHIVQRVEVSKFSPWVVDMEVLARHGSAPAVTTAAMAYLRVISSNWDFRFKNDIEFVASTKSSKLKGIERCEFRVKQEQSQPIVAPNPG